MSRAAQEVQRFADEQRRRRPKATKQRRTAVTDDDNDPRDDQARPDLEDTGGAPSDDLDIDPATTGQPEAAATTDETETDMAKKMSAKKPARRKERKERTARVPRAAKAVKAKVATSGIRESPKHKILFINRAAALALVDRLLRAVVKAGDLDEAERFEADRLIARIDARS